MHKVFVYGSLKRGYGNHHFLEKSMYQGNIVTHPEYTMYSLGAFPAVVEGGDTSIHGEVYEVTDSTMEALDFLEGYPSFYNRKKISTMYGDAWMYYHDEEPSHAGVVESGEW